jgi:superfamily II DNA or RNA helicase
MAESNRDELAQCASIGQKPAALSDACASGSLKRLPRMNAADRAEPLHLAFDRGTIVLIGDTDFATMPGVAFDARTGQHRAEGRHYRGIVEHLIRNKVPYTDAARGWDKAPLELKLRTEREPFPHQKEAVAAWLKAGSRGCVILPTGTGKSFVAVLAIVATKRPTLVICPTLDLMRQWYNQLTDFLGLDVGLVGGSYFEFKPVTVTTYDSAYRHVERWGRDYGLVVYDEVHHLPGPAYQSAATAALAPFRLGLTATPDRADGGEHLLPQLTGPIVYRKEIQELSGVYLADYETRVLYVDLSEAEQAEYWKQREIYRGFIARSGISLGGQNGWQRFIIEASRSDAGRAALKAWREQKRIERAPAAKFAELDRLLDRHAAERTIVFTADNATVHAISRKYLVPAITHQTKIKERKQILERFDRGEYTVVVTSQVLNEGVDVPAAAVGIVLSGTGSTRENVQRLGRILRKHGDKQAILYEVIARGTTEVFTSDRRRQHGAFGGEDSPVD